ncbi:MAG: ABC transporter substrate-binding protein [Gammaproteobacteria bacterium]|nr:ABC transporter substrate-binding protein [Gammaproteobacteria bacterium]CAJ2376458.1 MAG: Spermidine/putrescine-binding periplasmic protein [Arenicellales bacterium IbO2]MDA7961445.1 ABC transporter substrate-binding protein [Gammaproteobacteria bacterium]MDA7967638.1 ABC transporter substrate-binding protein [Gammaproteobacteria bacterium]MDA7969597.1 ABC transporter substrate-binding protein [Gammaproteobacteria bacterium]
MKFLHTFRRCFLPAVAALLFAGAAHAQTKLTIVSWGGAYTASQQKGYHEPYMRANPNIEIVNDDSGSGALAKLRAMQSTGKVTWDLVDMVAGDAIIACDEGIAVEIDHDKVLASAPDGTPASKDFGDLIVNDCYIPTIVYSTTFGYRTDLVKKKPTKIADVFDLKKIPGKRALEKRPNNNLEWALLADGVKPNKVYKMLGTEKGVKRAFKKLDTIKDQVIWWEKGAQTPQLLADGEVVIGSTYNGRLFSVIEEEKQPVAMMWDWQMFDLDGWIVPKGGKNEAEVMKYLYFATDTQRLADQAKYISYGPARKSSAPLVGKHAELGIEMGPHMPTAPANAKHTLLVDFEFWANNQDDLTERFNAWLAR